MHLLWNDNQVSYLDGSDAECLGRLEVGAKVIQENSLLWVDLELLQGVLVDASLRLAHLHQA